MANVEVENVDSIRRRLRVEIPAGEVASELDRAFADLSRNANVPGFRRGRAPRSVLERLAGDRLRAEVFEKLVRESFLDALRSEKIDPVGQPQISTEKAEPGQPLCYSATVEVVPEVSLGEYSGLEVERPLRTISDEDVDAVLDNMRSSAAKLEPITDRKSTAIGDVATVDYEARIGAKLAGKGEDRLVEVAAGGPGEIGAHLEGCEVGEKREFDVDYPEDFSNPDLAGKTVHFMAEVKALGLRELPDLDDDFAKAYGGCETLAEMKVKVREQLESQAQHDADGAVRNALVSRLVAGHDIEVPQAMVARRADGMVDEFIQSLGARRPPASREHEMRERLRRDVEPQASEQVKATLLLEAIAAREGLEILDSELEEEIDRFAQQAGTAGERVRALYQDPHARSALRAQRLRERALDRVVEQSRVSNVEAKTSIAADPGKS
jgi:trigger factor